MTENPQAAWLELFPEGTNEPMVSVPFRVLRRGGEPFLYLPTRNRAAARALDLFPAQSWKARLAKVLLQVGFRFSPLARGGGQPFPLPRQNAFLASLARMVGQPQGQIPEFAVLAGNPRAPGRRFVFLLFDTAGRPVAVVKAGCSERARTLIIQEAAILRECGGKVPGVPRLREEFVAGNAVAFATDFIAGNSPDGEARPELEALFMEWLDTVRKRRVCDLPVWQRLQEGDDPLPDLIHQLGQLEVFPTLMHGDLAPWNVKVAAGRWTVLDWERGERAGLPGWDWLHFLLQPAILVHRESVAKMLLRLEQLFASAEFARYAVRAGLAGYEWPFAAAYVCYSLRVTQQTEGSAGLKLLLQELLRRA